MDWIQQWQSKLNKQNGVAPLVRTGGSRHTGLAALPYRNIHNEKSIAGRFIDLCGRNSSNMWFLHCLYFAEATRNTIQPLAFFARNPILIYIVAVFELIVLSEIIDAIKSKVTSKIL